jgi:hypothetical protein
VRKTLLFGLALLPMLLVASPKSADANATRHCRGLFGSEDLFWRTKSPARAEVMERLPVGKRHNSGNMLSLNYEIRPDGRLRQANEFKKQWDYIFGTGPTSGYGEIVRGRLAPGAHSSWGRASRINKKNLSECIVDGTTPAICLGIPSSSVVPPMSLGQHTGWMIFDKDSDDPRSLKNLGVGDHACLTYKVMYSSNFDFNLGYETKIPGFGSAPDGRLPPNDHLCEGTRRTVNTGESFSTRVVVGGRGDSPTAASGKLLGHFKDDMLDVTCKRFRVMTEMHAQDPRTNALMRGVWYRVEHELILNSNYDPRPGQRSGAFMRLSFYDDRTGQHVTSFGMANTFTFEGLNYPLMPRRDPSGKIEGMFVSMQQTHPEPGTRGFAIAVRDFEFYLK